MPTGTEFHKVYRGKPLREELDPVDVGALDRCLVLARQEKSRGQQLDSMLAEPRPWFEVATFAAYGVQMASLRLYPWESPPCWYPSGDAGGDADLRAIEAAALARRLIDHGISVYEPDPLRALRAAGVA